MHASHAAEAALNRSALFSSLDLEQTVAAYLNGEASQDNVAVAYYRSSRVNRLIAHACQKYRSYISMDFAQEIKQELALLLNDKFLKTIKDSSAIYNILHVSACFIARRRAEKVFEDSLEHIQESAQAVEDPGHFDPVQELEDLIDHRRAVEDFNRRAAKPKEPAVPIAPASRAVAKKTLDTATKPVEPLTPIMPSARTSNQGTARSHAELDTPLRIYFDLRDVQVVERAVNPRRERSRGPVGPTPRSTELKAIREQMHLPIETFGALLGVKKPLMTAYIYGHLYLPERILSEARLLQRNQSTEILELGSRFDGVPMAQIIDGWLAKLGLQSAGRSNAPADAKLGKLLGVSRVTIWRWRHEKMRPELRDIGAFDALVRKRAATRKPSE